MAELSFRLIIQSSDATGKLQSVKQEAEAVQNAVEKPSTFKVDAAQSLATVRDLSIALQGVMQVINGAAQAMKGFLDEALSARQALQLAKITFGEAAKEMSNYAQSMQSIVNVDGDKLLVLMAKMHQTYGVNLEDIKALTPSILDWAQANESTGLTVESAYELIGKALNGHTEMLSRNGLELDDNRLKSEGVSYVIDVLTNKYNGSAKALADLRIQNGFAWGDIKESLGDMLNVIITPLMQGLRDLMAWYQSLSPVMKGFVAGLAIAIPVVITVTSAISALTIAVHALKTAINPVAGVIGIVVGVLATMAMVGASAATATEDVGEAQKTMTEQIDDINQAVDTESTKFNMLATRLLELRSQTNLTVTSKHEMKGVIDDLNKNYKEYLGNINLETAGYNSLAAALTNAANALVNKKISDIYGEAYDKQLAKVASLTVQLQKKYGADLANAMIAHPPAENKPVGPYGATFVEPLLRDLLLAKDELKQFQAEYAKAKAQVPVFTVADLGAGKGAAGESEADKAKRELEQRKKETMDLIADLAEARKTETSKIQEEYDKRLADITEFTDKDSAAQKTAIDDLSAWKAAKEQELVDDEKQKVKDKFTTQIDYYSNLESLGVSSYDALKKQMEDYYAWAKVNLTEEEAALILAQLQETNLRWGEHNQEKIDKEKAHLQELQDTRDEFYKQDLSFVDDSYNAQLLAIDRYYESRHAKMREAGIAEVEIERQKADAIKALEEQTMLTAARGVSGIFSTFASAANKESKKGFAMWKALSIAQGYVDTFTAAIGAYKSMVGIPVVGPGLAVAAAAAAMAAGLMNIGKISAMKYEPPQAARGGYLNGPAHSQGGVIIEAEGDEYITAKNRVKELGRGLFDFLNFAPIAQVKMALSGLSVPYVPMPAMAGGAFANGGAISGGAGLGILIDIMSDLKDEIKELKKAAASKPNFIINVDPLSNNPVKVSEINDKGKLIRSGF